MTKKEAILRAALQDAIHTIDDLAEQQAMPDDSYEEAIERYTTILAETADD